MAGLSYFQIEKILKEIRELLRDLNVSIEELEPAYHLSGHVNEHMAHLYKLTAKIKHAEHYLFNEKHREDSTQTFFNHLDEALRHADEYKQYMERQEAHDYILKQYEELRKKLEHLNIEYETMKQKIEEKIEIEYQLRHSSPHGPCPHPTPFGSKKNKKAED